MTLNDRFGYERLQRRIDDPENKAVVVIIVNQDDTLDSAAVGIDNPQGLFSVLVTALNGVYAEVMESLTDEQRRNAPPIILPTQEQARELGIIRPINGTWRRQ